MTKEQILDHFKNINHAYNESTRYDDLKRMLDEFEFGRATVCDEDGRLFKVVVDGVTYYADDPKVKTIHEKTGEVVIGGFYKDGYL